MTHRKGLLIALAAMVLVVAGPAMMFGEGRGENTGSSGSSTSTTVDSQAMAEATKNLATIQYSFREVAKKVLPVVVEVDVTAQAGTQNVNPFDFFFNQPQGNNNGQPRLQQGLASGIIVRKTGDTYYVLTNNHVVAGSTKLSIKLQDTTVINNVKVVGTDAKRDLAVLSFTSKLNLPVAELGDSSQLQVGDIVLAVGNPLNLESTITMGIVSALGRSAPRGSDIAASTDYIQTDAAINQGNSGGALVNIEGKVVGINTWIYNPAMAGNLGFAIPINNAKKVVEDVISTGKVEYGWLGVSLQDPGKNSAQDDDNLPGVPQDLRLDGIKGALIIGVFKGSPAERAGFLPGDYITKANGQEATDSSKLIQIVSNLLAGKSYDFEVIRYGEKAKVSVKLGSRPADGSDEISYRNFWPGMVVVHINDAARQALNDASIPKGVDGVMIGYLATGGTTDNASPASIAGFRPYDVITQVNGKAVNSVLDFYKALNDKSKGAVSFKVTRQGTDVTISMNR